MKQYTIRKGKHRARPMMLGLWYNKQSISYRVTFENNCKYYIEGEDQQDINKLFGVGYLPTHHQESARFGWRYNAAINKIDLFAYCYVKGVRVVSYITSCSFNRSYDLSIDIKFGIYRFIVRKDGGVSESEINYYHSKKIGYPLSVYFGGNKVAPQQMDIYLKKL